jgi:membrane-bound serine protease (ClpP class)
LRKALVILIAVFALNVPAAASAQPGAHLDLLTVNGVIDTWVASYIERGISAAERDGAEGLVILLNTPGGTLGAMQNITTSMLNARVPLVVFVYPAGAWAASAGTFVTLAANIAAMAPGTTIGAAHPVDQSGQNISSDERTKVTNFSVALIQSIAQQRGRNAGWAAQAVQNSIAATAQEALDQGVIDLLANDPNDLLNKIDGKTVTTAAGEITLHTRQAGLVRLDMNLPERFFHTLVDPNVALVLLLVGLLAIAVELFSPGAVVPGVTGSICLVLAFVALGSLPVNWGGAILIALSIILFIIDIKANSLVLTIGGLVMFVLGALLLFTRFTAPSPVLPQVSVSPILVLALAGILAAFFMFVLGAAVRARTYPVLSGKESLIGAVGTAASDLVPGGTVRIKGELWTAVVQEGSVHRGDIVQVVGIEGLRLRVVKLRQSSETYLKDSTSREV